MAARRALLFRVFFSIILLDIAASTNLQFVRTYCSDVTSGPCYDLYKSLPGITWSQAQSACADGLATHVNLRSIDEIPGKIWVGGRKVQDGYWLDMAGQKFNGMSPYTSRYSKCGVYNNLYSKIMGRTCTVTRGTPKLALCQYHNNGELCPSDSQVINNKCYTIPDEWFQTWSEASSYCSKEYQSGELAYRNITSPALSTFIQNWLTVQVQYSISTELWVGIRKREWFWVQRGNITSPLDFMPEEYDITTQSGEQCLVLDAVYHGISGNHGNIWKADTCEMLLQHALCERKKKVEEGVTSTIRMTTSGRTPPIKQTTQATDTDDVITRSTTVRESTTRILTTTPSDENSQHNPITMSMLLSIAVIVPLLVVFIIVIIILIVLFCKRKRKSTHDPFVVKSNILVYPQPLNREVNNLHIKDNNHNERSLVIKNGNTNPPHYTPYNTNSAKQNNVNNGGSRKSNYFVNQNDSYI